MTHPELRVRALLSIDRELFCDLARLWHKVNMLPLGEVQTRWIGVTQVPDPGRF